MRDSHKAWLGLAAGVTAYEIACKPGETLSEGLDELMEHRYWRYAVGLAVGVTAAHLCNMLPNQYDPYSRALSWKDRGGDAVQT